MRNRKTAQTTRARHVKNAHKSVGRRLSPAVSLDECRRKRLVVSGIQNPALRRDRCECGAAAERKVTPKPEGFGGVRIGNYDTKTKEHTEWCALLFWCTREPTVRSCVFLRRHKAGGGFAAQNQKTHFWDSEPRFAPGYGAVAALRQGAKPVQSPRALEGFESGPMRPKEKPPSSREVFFWCTFRDSNPGPTD